jgi:PIN domain
MLKIVFLDTNIIVHYQSFDQVDWLKITEADAVKIIITPVNIRELNTIKDSPAHLWFRKRAQDILTKISRLIDDSLSVTLNANIELQVEHRDPLVDFGVYHLDQRIQDDNLIASILMLRQEMPDANIVLITADDGVTLLAKARPHGIRTIRMPQELRLPEELNVDREKIKELEQKIREITAAMPRLSLAFENGDQHTTFSLARPLILPSTYEKDQKLEEIKQKYPRSKSQGDLSVGDSDLSTSISEISKALQVLQGWAAADQSAITIYNTELDEFYVAYSEYLFHETNYENLSRRMIVLPIWILNDGTAPADDIDIHMHIPEGLQIFTEKNIPKPPNAPTPPKLKTKYDLITERMGINVPLHSLSHDYYRDNSSLPPQTRNVSAPSIRRTKSYEVRIHVERIKHTFRSPFDPLFLLFDSFESAEPFHLDYSIVAANVPTETSGQLHIIVEKETN